MDMPIFSKSQIPHWPSFLCDLTINSDYPVVAGVSSCAVTAAAVNRMGSSEKRSGERAFFVLTEWAAKTMIIYIYITVIIY